MKLFLFPRMMLCAACLALTVHAMKAADQKPGPEAPKDLDEIKTRALEVMAEVVPHGPATLDENKISFEGSYAEWGWFFHDETAAALVAVGKIPPNMDEGDLCLLVWDGTWQFRQWVGKVGGYNNGGDTKPNDWRVRRPHSASRVVVVPRADFYVPRDHPSWFCDPQTHTLIPTGWPKDAFAGIIGETITFTRPEQPGVTPEINEIYHFKDRVGDWIATWQTDSLRPEGLLMTIAVPDAKTKAPVTWRVRFLGQENLQNHAHRRYALCRSVKGKEQEPFRKDAVADFEWTYTSDESEENLLLHRLTGLHRAFRGEWDGDTEPPQDPRHPTLQSVTVTGLPEAVEKLSWPTGGSAGDY